MRIKNSVQIYIDRNLHDVDFVKNKIKNILSRKKNHKLIDSIAFDRTILRIECDGDCFVSINDILIKLKIPFLHQVKAVYDPSDFDGNKLFVCIINTNPTAEYISVPKFDVDSVDSCRVCMSGARVIESLPLKIEKTAANNAINQMYRGPILLDTVVHNALIDAGVDKNNFLRVRCLESGKSNEDRYIIRPICVLNKFHESTSGLVRGEQTRDAPCQDCGRDGYFYTTREPFVPVFNSEYISSVFSKTSDRPLIAATWEHFGVGLGANRPGNVLPADPAIVGNQQVRAIFNSFSRNCEWIPVASAD